MWFEYCVLILFHWKIKNWYIFVPSVLCLFNSWTRQKLGIFSYLWKDFLREIRLVHPSCVLRNVIKNGLCLWFVNFLGRFCYNFLKVNTIWVNLFILFLLLFSFLCMSLFFTLQKCHMIWHFLFFVNALFVVSFWIHMLNRSQIKKSFQ